MKILLVDDHGMFLDGMLNILNEVEEIKEVAAISDPSEALAILKKRSIDVLITDISMPGMTGKQLCKEALKINPNIRTLVVTMHDEYHHISSLLEAGAAGYLLKNTRQDELIEAIMTVYQGRNYYSNEVKDIIVESMSRSPNSTIKIQQAKLTEREIQIVKLIATEHTTQEIADKLYISLYTVESHRKNIMRKTDTRNMAGLIKYALKAGVIE